MNRINTPINTPTTPNITMTDAEFDLFMETNLKFARSLLEDKPSGVTPQLIVKTVDMDWKTNIRKTNINVFVIGNNFNDFEEKRKTLGDIGKHVYDLREIPVAVALISEAWTARNPPKNTMPRDCQNKREILLVAAKDFEAKHSKMVAIHVTRDANNGMEATDEPEMGGENNDVDSPILDHFFRGFAAAAHNREHRN